MRISDWSSDVCSSDLGAEHRGQYIVEIMRDAARELADRLHLRRLRDLALEARFLARILEAEQHRRLAQPAHPDDAHRYRIAALPREADRQVAADLLPAAVAADHVGKRPLVLADDDVAGIARHPAFGQARGAHESAVHIQEP